MKTELTTVPFHGTKLLAVRGETPADTIVFMKPIAEGMGLDWEGQRQKLESHPVLSTCTFVIKAQVPGDDQVREHVGLALPRLNFSLATMQATAPFWIMSR